VLGGCSSASRSLLPEVLAMPQNSARPTLSSPAPTTTRPAGRNHLSATTLAAVALLGTIALGNMAIGATVAHAGDGAATEPHRTVRFKEPGAATKTTSIAEA
jgi:hypothetical protein